MKSKINSYLFIGLITLGLFFNSCNNNNHTAESAVVDTTPCDCSELNTGHGPRIEGKAVKQDTIIFTGTCHNIDQYDSIITIKVYEKGFLKHQIERNRIFGAYITTSDISYDIEGKVMDGYNLLIHDTYHMEDLQFVHTATIWKGGKITDKYSFSISYIKGYKDGDDNWNAGTITFSIKYDFKNGKDFTGATNNKEAGQPKCLPIAEYKEGYFVANRENGTGLKTGTSSNLGDEWCQQITLSSAETPDFNEFFQIMECLKTELPRFNFIKKK
jgi:hypothetical protein